jgi:hypothetical protein
MIAVAHKNKKEISEFHDFLWFFGVFRLVVSWLQNYDRGWLMKK